MARRTKEEMRDEIRGRRANGSASGGTKLAGLQDEAERILAESGLELPAVQDDPTPADEAEAEAGLRGIVGPNGRPVQAKAQSEDDVLEAAQRVLAARAERARRPKAPDAPNALLGITLQAQVFFEKQGYKGQEASQLTLAYSILEVGNVLSGLRDRMFPPTRQTNA